MSDVQHHDAGTGDCAITVLHARGRRLAKLIRANGRIIGYDDAKHFDAVEIVVHDLDHLAGILRSLLPCWDRCAVRGSLINGSAASRIRRLYHPDPETGDQPTLYEVPRRHVAVDVDNVPLPLGIAMTDIAACARIAIQSLPLEFHGRACIAMATGGHGIKPGVIRLRLWFWLDGAATRKTLQGWFFGHDGIDLATFRTAQLCYTAAPVLARGVTDPVPDRLVVIPGEPLVTIRPLPPAPPSREAAPQKAAAQAGGAAQSGAAGQAGEGPRSVPPSSGVRADRYRDAALAGIKGHLLVATEGHRHHALVAAACRLCELGSLSDGYIQEFIHRAAVVLNRRGSRQIDAEEVDEALEWARARTAGGRRAA
jgi:hypothetical protein